MANLPETIQWDAGVYQIEIIDKVTGGVDGIVNKAPKALANRTAYLKDRVEALDASALAQQNELALKAPLDSPTLTGTPTVPTAVAGTNTTQVASTAYVRTEIANLVDSSPATLDTLNELAAALGDDPNFATTMTNALATKAPLASPTFTGTPAAPTAAADTSTTQLASTAFVIGQAGAATPLVDGVAAVGTSKKYSREDHIHPTDITRAPLASPVFTGSALVNGDGVGYGTGSGGAVTQATSKSTGVTLDKACGSITLNNESLASNTSVAFTLTNAKIAATDVVLVSIKSGATSLAYLTQVEAVAAGSCKIVLRNVSAGALGEAVVLNFAVIKAVAA